MYEYYKLFAAKSRSVNIAIQPVKANSVGKLKSKYTCCCLCKHWFALTGLNNAKPLKANQSLKYIQENRLEVHNDF